MEKLREKKEFSNFWLELWLFKQIRRDKTHTRIRDLNYVCTPDKHVIQFEISTHSTRSRTHSHAIETDNSRKKGYNTKFICKKRSLALLTCFKMPTSNSSTLCCMPDDVSMNFASILLANALPSADGITRERAKSALFPTKMTAFSFVTFSRHKYLMISSAWRNDDRFTTE